jgi:hypothetical protein
MKHTKRSKNTRGSHHTSNPTEQKQWQLLRTYIKQEWRTHATAAWDNFQQYGRGFILLEGIPPRKMGYCAQQLPEQADAFKQLSLLPELDNLIKTYDPTKQVIFVVLFPEGEKVHVHFSAYAEHPSPPEAWVTFKDFKNSTQAKS